VGEIKVQGDHQGASSSENHVFITKKQKKWEVRLGERRDGANRGGGGGTSQIKRKEEPGGRLQKTNQKVESGVQLWKGGWGGLGQRRGLGRQI